MAPRIPRVRRNRTFLMAAVIMAILFFHRTIRFAYIDLGYLLRPLWDKESGDFRKIIPHYYAEGMSMKDRCEAHGWRFNTDPNRVKPRLYDALTFSVELDLLEIRIRELWDVVDHFIIMESNMTFTGLHKELTFAENRKRFAFAESKIIYKNLEIPYVESETAWIREGYTRSAMTALFKELGLTKNDMFTSVDVDELIYPHTLELIKACDNVPDTIHLQLKNYLYSFEFPTGETIWKPFVHRWSPSATYSRIQVSGELLTDA
ncbi:hypothetical protein CPB97_010432, partial [Podila verticillata]